MLRPQDTSSAPEGEYLATAGAATRIKASTDPEYHVVQVRGRPYHLPVLQELPRGGKGQGGKSQGGKGGGKGRANNKAHELDLYRTSATVVREAEEMQDPASTAMRAVPDAPMDSRGKGRGGGDGEGGKGKGKGEGGKGKVHDPAAAVKAFNDAIEGRGGRGGRGGDGDGEGGGKGKGKGEGRGKGEGGKGKGEGGKGKGEGKGKGR